ncbi:hypothetical protein [uncultured Thiodictyon sp.]|uniref:hypothetical protein n=1 Tax=uncultured Thiodictyon sp. TaxID=1846217 RepID=UPI0025DBD238|nr:hypothetical protein [uncultured Thiodictyon sp.]
MLIKTAKGQDEIRTKANKLSMRSRRFLILVDGQSTVGDLLTRLAVLGDDIEALLEDLVADGFLAPRDTLPPPRAAAPAAQAPSLPTEFNLDKAKGFARYIVLGNLGPLGGRRAERIEAARSAGELRVELDELREQLPKLLPKRQAKQVWDQLEPLILSATVADDVLAPRDRVPDTPAAPPPAPATAAPPLPADFNLDKAKGFARYIVLGALGPVGARRAERIEAARSPGDLRLELEDLREALPKLLSKRQAQQVGEQIEPLIQSISQLQV